MYIQIILIIKLTPFFVIQNNLIQFTHTQIDERLFCIENRFYLHFHRINLTLH